MPTAAPAGARQIYRAKYCAAVVEFMGRGYSLTAFAGEIGVTRATLMDWSEKHARFAAAVEQGQARRARLLEDRLLAARGAAAFGAHMQALQTAAPEEWPAKRPAARGPATACAAPTADADVELPDNGRG